MLSYSDIVVLYLYYLKSSSLYGILLYSILYGVHAHDIHALLHDIKIIYN